MPSLVAIFKHQVAGGEGVWHPTGELPVPHGSKDGCEMRCELRPRGRSHWPLMRGI